MNNSLHKPRQRLFLDQWSHELLVNDRPICLRLQRGKSAGSWVVHSLVKEQLLDLFQGPRVVFRDPLLEGFIRLETSYDLINIPCMLDELLNSHLQTHLLDGGQVLAAAHDADLHELLPGASLEESQGGIVFEALVRFEVVQAEHLAGACELQLHEELGTAVGNQV